MITDNFDYTKMSVSYPDKKDYIIVNCMTEGGNVVFTGMRRANLKDSLDNLESAGYHLITEVYRKLVSRNEPVTKFIDGHIFLLKPDHEGYAAHLKEYRSEKAKLNQKFFADLKEEYDPLPSEELHCVICNKVRENGGSYRDMELKYEEFLDFAETVLNLKGE